MAPPSKKQMSLFSPEEGTHFTPTAKEAKSENFKAAGFILSPPGKKTFKRKSRADGIYLPEEKKPLTYGLRFEEKRQRIPEWALPKISTNREDVLRIIEENDEIGLDFEYNPSTHYLSIIGVAFGNECAGCRYDSQLGAALLKKIKNPRSRFIGHFVLGADKPVLEESMGEETPLWLWEDSMIAHYLAMACLAKAPGKEADGDGALGFMGLGFAAHFWTSLPMWKECLHPLTKVVLEDGTEKTIKYLVDTKYSGKVMSYDAGTKTYVAKRITDWYEVQRGTKKMFDVSFKYGEKNRKARVTEDHLILVKSHLGDTWVRADELRPTHQINTGTLGFGCKARGLLAGMFLGDSHLSREGDIYIHGCDKEYQELKQQIFDGIGGHTWISDSEKPNCRPCYNFKSFRVPSTRELADKDISSWIKNNFTRASLAIWYLDDGYLSKDNQAEICCNWLSITEAEEYVEIIKNRLDITGYIPARCYKSGKPRIFFTVAETVKLSRLIREYVPVCMEYKILEQDRGRLIPYMYSVLPEPFYSTAIVRSTDKQFYTSKVYCIDVEDTRNFKTNGGIVHNCRGLYCEGPCPSHAVYDYCAVDSWAGLEVFNRCKDFMRIHNIPWRVYEEHKELALNFCLAAEKRGMIVDLDYARKLEEEMEKKKENLFPKGNPRFNPRSNIQVVKWFEKNGLKLTANDKGTVELALEARIHETLGLTTIGEIDDESEAMMDEVTRALYDLYIFKSMGKGTDAWVAEKYIAYE